MSCSKTPSMLRHWINAPNPCFLDYFRVLAITFIHLLAAHLSLREVAET
ncbi:hypothetical protein NFB56_17175 [Yersinia ruckeri]|nr:hypothetical protein [Yersinia ruckeri]EKN3348042.1 hypothetical protein [Yersinia ruckeri]ELM3748444.1 hypothetical protein [Yersinia ruckeri]MCK8563095.1 hypothetical protein [Yersinia ruckeri]MCW6550562.1 hypothetical protein [Yersinia ruckeri]MCW6633929.1 hypothetical protein [Yersinia ruckeri]